MPPVELSGAGYWKPHSQSSGPNGQVKMFLSTFRVDRIRVMLESLDHFDTSRIEQLTINVTLRHIASSHIALHSNRSPSGVVACLVIVLSGMAFDMEIVTDVVAARALRGAKPRSIGIVDKDKPAGTDVLELQKYVLHVECGPDACGVRSRV